MYVWSKRIVITLLVAFGVLQMAFWSTATGDGTSVLTTRATHWLGINYFLLVVWVFVWIFDQARVRGKNAWVWLFPLLVAPLPTLMAFVLILQRRLK